MSIRKIGATLFVVTIIFIPVRINAGRGCCSHHGGTAGCTTSGRQICGDGTLSPSCGCTPPIVYGCTDSSASNYNSSANQDDGSCVYYVYGCTDPNANNYNASANQDNGTCIYHTLGCTDVSAENYNPNANQDDGSCTYKTAETKETQSSKTEYEKEYSDDNNAQEENDPFGTIIGLGTLAGGVYVYKKIKGK